MGVLIDSTVLIDHERGRLDLEGHIAERDDEPFLLSVVSVSELLHGVHRAGDRTRRAHRSAFVEAIADRFPILSLDLPTARAHAELRAELATSGQLIGAHDLWLAAAALAHGLTLVTADVRHFHHVEGLTVEDWGA